MAIDLAGNLAKRGFPSSVIALDEGGRHEDLPRAAGVDYHIVGRRSFRTLRYHADMRALLGAINDTRRKGGDLRIAGLQPQVERVLALAGFTGIIKVFADVGAAVASYRT